LGALLSIVVPALNEEASITRTVSEILAAIPSSLKCELILVSDGSSDSTVSRMLEVRSTIALPVIVVDQPSNRGLGAAVSSGIEVASGTWITWIPADGEYTLSQVLRQPLDCKQLATTMYFRTNRIQAARTLVSKIMYSWIWIMFGVRTHDFCGIFLMPRQTFIDLQIGSNGSIFALEVLIKLHRRSLAFQRESIDWHPRTAGRSKVFSLHGLLQSAVQLILLRFRISTTAR
jgi:glycosyltransferase involved in cell wall biosynthesis